MYNPPHRSGRSTARGKDAPALPPRWYACADWRWAYGATDQARGRLHRGTNPPTGHAAWTAAIPGNHEPMYRKCLYSIINSSVVPVGEAVALKSVYKATKRNGFMALVKSSFIDVKVMNWVWTVMTVREVKKLFHLHHTTSQNYHDKHNTHMTI